MTGIMMRDGGREKKKKVDVVMVLLIIRAGAYKLSCT
jgi:hypothetical protein